VGAGATKPPLVLKPLQSLLSVALALCAAHRPERSVTTYELISRAMAAANASTSSGVVLTALTDALGFFSFLGLAFFFLVFPFL
jgi:hypothetical protein